MAKGSILDLIYLIIWVFIIGIFVILGSHLNTQFQSGFEEQGFDTSSFEYSEQGLSTFNYGFIFIILGIIMAIVLGVYYLRTNPVIFFFSLIVLAIVLVLAAVFSNTFLLFEQTPALADSVESFNILHLVINNLVLFILGGGILAIIVFYGKSHSERGEV